MIERFNREKFYSAYYESKTRETVGLDKKDGRDLASQYLSRKYRFDVFEYHDFLHIRSYRRFIEQAVYSCGQEMNYRCSGIFIGSGHAVSLSYIRERGISAILHNDSIGTSNKTIPTTLLATEFPDLPIYSISQGRQRDLVSCYTDALIIAKNTCGRKIGSEEFLIKDLLSFLNSHSSYSDYTRFFNVSKLPCLLLKTSQLYTFINFYHQEECNYHKCTARDRKHNLDYIRIKGISLAHKIEIDFYRTQLMQYANTDEVNETFVKNAMQFTKNSSALIPIYESANKSLIDQINMRDGIAPNSTAQKIACLYTTLILIQASVVTAAYFELSN